MEASAWSPWSPTVHCGHGALFTRLRAPPDREVRSRSWQGVWLPGGDCGARRPPRSAQAHREAGQTGPREVGEAGLANDARTATPIRRSAQLSSTSSTWTSAPTGTFSDVVAAVVA